MLTISSLVLSTALFLAMLMNVALKPKFSKNITAVCMIIGLIGGLIFYGIGFAEATGNLALSVLRTPFTVIRMFIGINELAAIGNSSLVSTTTGLVIF